MPGSVPRLKRYRFLFAVSSVAACTLVFWLCRHFLHFLDKAHFALLYLPVVMLVASVSGARAGVLTAVMAFLSFDFFLVPPYYTLTVSDPTDWLLMAIFVLAGLVIGLQGGRMWERESYALARERETALLYRLSAQFAEETELNRVADVLLKELMEVAGASRAALFVEEGSTLRLYHHRGTASEEEWARVKDAADWAQERAREFQLPAVTDLRDPPSEQWPVLVRGTEGLSEEAPHDLFLPLQAGSRLEGLLHVGGRADHSPASSREEHILLSIAHLAAAFLERRRLQAAAAQADALREADILKTTFVSSVSHELKTPLAAVTGAVTSLVERDVHWDPEAVRQELQEVSHDLGRLNTSIGKLLDLSRLEGRAWKPRREWYDLGEIIGTVLSSLTPAHRERICLRIPDDLPPVCVDYLQWVSAIQNLVQNALIYSPADSPVSIGAAAMEDEVSLWVEDRGPGISPADRPHLFEKFYRGRSSASAPSGTGLGLAIIREIARFHGGQVEIEDVEPHGARFRISIPR